MWRYERGELIVQDDRRIAQKIHGVKMKTAKVGYQKHKVPEPVTFIIGFSHETSIHFHQLKTTDKS